MSALLSAGVSLILNTAWSASIDIHSARVAALKVGNVLVFDGVGRTANPDRPAIAAAAE